MRISTHVLVAGCVITAGFVLAAFESPRAQTAGQGPVPYTLSPASEFLTGCFGPCDCAVFSVPLRGDFQLELTADNGLFRTYALRNIDWTFGPPGVEKAIAGAGVYRVGGEVAVQHELTLDLRVAGRDQHFDSGLVAGTDEFPQIDIHAAARGFACTDTVLSLSAHPLSTTGIDPSRSTELTRIEPDPFTGSTRVFFALAAPARVDLRIYDVRGWAVRTLSRDAPYEPGPNHVAWDGCDGDGRRCPAGTYIVRFVAAGRETVDRVVKLR
jgi:flagellar hook capping protein FlgD